jgi:nucleotidyltransferase substrate binding protein (TIGR01987 family)
MPVDPKPRWIYRYQNFTKALDRLNQAAKLSSQDKLNDLEKEGLVQRFEYTWELTWNVLHDYLRFSGISIEVVSPGDVLRAAYSAGIISNGDTWMEAKRDRNLTSHRYDEDEFERIVVAIRETYVPLIDALHIFLSSKLPSPNDQR